MLLNASPRVPFVSFPFESFSPDSIAKLYDTSPDHVSTDCCLSPQGSLGYNYLY